MEDKKSIWNDAGKAGLVLGGVSILYLLLSWVLGMISSAPVLVSIISAILWIAKFSACLYLMRLLMLKYSTNFPSADNSDVFRFGAFTALLSAVVYSAAYLAYMKFLAPDMLDSVMETLKANPMMDSASLSAMEELMPKLPTITFFVNIVYCSLFGIVLSAIFSRNIPPKNPFSKPE